jgi:hypothetical protein
MPSWLKKKLGSGERENSLRENSRREVSDREQS